MRTGEQSSHCLACLLDLLDTVDTVDTLDLSVSLLVRLSPGSLAVVGWQQDLSLCQLLLPLLCQTGPTVTTSSTREQ